MIYPWQTPQWQHVNQQYTQQRLPHALLLTGAMGLGKVEFARHVMQYLLCEAPQSEAACQTCRHCRLYLAGNHPDCFELTPLETSRVIKVDQVRELIDKLSQTPQLAQRQIVLLHPLETMNAKAANAFLKTLEEPTGNVTFLLVSHRLAGVPITILSRCQKLHFHMDSHQHALTWLQQQLPQHNNHDILLKLADDMPLQAKYYAETNFIELRDLLLKKLSSLHQENPLSGIDAILKYEIYDVLRVLYIIASDLQKCHLGVTDQLQNADCKDMLIQLAQKRDSQQIQKIFDAIAGIETTLRRGIHINPQLALESLFLKELACL